MLNENIKSLRKQNGLSQEELANEMHVVRQTVSKWERGLSVPDSDSLIKLAEILHTKSIVWTTFGCENVEEIQQTELDKISEKLEEINLQFFENKQKKSRFTEIYLS